MARKTTMGKSLLVSGLVVLALIMVSSPRKGNAEINCGSIVTKLITCLEYLEARNGVTVPTNQCCKGATDVDNIVAAAASVPDDKKALCMCFREIATAYPIKADREPQFSKLCNLKIDIRFDRNATCDS
ncbi:Non-specific lipid-transfer protein 3 [Camellia lanceoleosa]|uniref:Non-specific lipid-transfer protein 3 n=1 Tax=Camellia lanceoleosa TaxID=1840588 RepID=A0ACC0HAD6_9ERIC|nr:Non-specific lipid-transfer protein 3 [Camellia lanceoleosa]